MKVKLCNSIKNNKYAFYAAGIVMSAVVIMFIAFGVAPFGDNTVLVGDGITQYIPFLSELRYKLVNGESLYYSWNMGMGMNFYSVMAYYLTSPFNILLVFASRDNIIVCIHFIWIMKIVLSAFAMGYYLLHSKKRVFDGKIVVFISVAYALNNFVFGFGNNIMWLDCIVLLPLIILGFERLMDKEGNGLYIITLALSMYCNYYLSFIMCIFLFLYFFVQKFQNFKDFLLKGVRFGISSILAAGSVAFLLLPTFKALMSTSSAGEGFPDFYTYVSIFDIFNKQFFGTQFVVNDDNYYLNVYCGVIVIITTFVYAGFNKIILSERIRKLLLLLFMFVSCNEDVLNFIWHGFHEQVRVPNRFSFLMIFLILDMAYEVLSNINNISNKNIITGVIVGLLYVVLCVLFSTEPIAIWVVVTTFVLIVIYGILMLFVKESGKKIAVAMVSVAIIELLANMYIGYSSFAFKNIYEYYPQNNQIVDVIEKYEGLCEKDEFARMEFINCVSLGESIWYNMKGVTVFSSTAYNGTIGFMKDMGNKSGVYRYYYGGMTPFTDSIYNVKYVIGREGDFIKRDFDVAGEEGNIIVYENPYPLSLGFAVPEETLEWQDEYGLAFDNQNNLIRLMTGQTDIFKDMKFVVKEVVTGQTLDEKYMDYNFYEDMDMYRRTGYELTVEEEGNCYLYIYPNAGEVALVNYGEHTYISPAVNEIINLGYVKNGEKIYVEVVSNIKDSYNPSAIFFMAKFDEESYKKAYTLLSDELMVIDELKTGYVKGNISMNETGILFTSIPYDTSWKVYVDGKSVRTESFNDAFVVVPLEKGEHKIEMKFVPEGLKEGWIISILCILTVVTTFLVGRKKK